MRTVSIIALGMMLAWLPGCLTTMDTPTNFVVVDRGDLGNYKVKAVSAGGVVVGLRMEDNPKRGTLEFWSEAIGDELTAARGYKPVKSEPVTSASGLPGRLMEFSTMQQGSQFTYMVALYVTSAQVALAEAGGKTDALSKRAAEIRASLLSVR